MKASEDLFILIKSLSQNEKRHFKIYASRHTIGRKNIYLKLFDIISKQKIYNEHAIKKYFYGQTFIKQLTFTKNYLYNQILESLTAYHTNLSVEAKLKNILLQVEILNKRSLYEQCHKLLVKAKSLAKAYEKHLHILEILKWERRLVHTVPNAQNTQYMDGYYNESEYSVNTIKDIIKYDKTHYRIFSFHVKEGGFRSKSKMIEFKKMLDKELIKMESKPSSFDAKRFLYNTHYFYFKSIKHDPVNAYVYSKKLVVLFEAFPNQIEEQTENYIAALNNLIIGNEDFRDHEEHSKNIKKMRKLSQTIFKNSENSKKLIFEKSYNLELAMCEATGQFEKGCTLIKEIEAGLTQYRSKISPLYEFLLHSQISVMYFGAGNYHKALEWINKTQQKIVPQLREDLVCNARILNLLIHFELGHVDYLEYAVKSTSRFLYKKERLYKFETTILSYLKKASNVNSETMIQLLESLKQELLLVLKDPYEKSIFDFISWIESKIEDRGFAKIIKEKANNKFNN
ncbi:MAG: hypothetical protein ACT4ON_00910 [Bacteroidota bacterium]